MVSGTASRNDTSQADAVAPRHRATYRRLFQRLVEVLDIPMVLLAFVWLALAVVELVWGLSPALQTLGLAIWVIFLLEFVLELALSPQKLEYLRKNWLTAIALVIPALRIFRIFSAIQALGTLQAARSFSLVRVIATMNRSMRALRRALAARGIGYVAALTLVVLFAGAAGMYSFEHVGLEQNGFHNYPAALFWTAMLMTTIGSEYWPRTPEGRVLCLLLAIFGISVYGYVTASLASFFVGRDADDPASEVAGSDDIKALRDEIRQLRAELRRNGDEPQ